VSGVLASTKVPVVAITGYLGAGKTTVLNNLLRHPAARVGVIVNDFGDINIDAALVTGQVDEPYSITGGCVCCLPDGGGFELALEKLSSPKLALDVILIESSGLADPTALSNMVRFSGVERTRHAGLVEVVDTVEYFRTIDTGVLVPHRFAAATLVVLNKVDQLESAVAAETLARIESRIRQRNATVHIVHARRGQLDPALLYDSAASAVDDQLPIRELYFDTHPPHHDHADAVSATNVGPTDAGLLLDFLERPPHGVYRIKGTVAVDAGSALRGYQINVVGRSIHIASRPAPHCSELVAIGMHLDLAAVTERLTQTLEPTLRPGPSEGLRRLQRYRRLSQY
jgi:G3E family GTPase